MSAASQAARAALELELLADRWNNDDLPADKRVQIKHVVFRLRGTGTLPWHLSEAEKQEISNAWMEAPNQEALRELAQFFSTSP